MKTFIASCLALLAALVSTAALAQLTPLGIPRSSPSPSPALAPGLYVSVIDGLVNLSNKGGTTTFAPGQFGFTPSFTTPPAPIPKTPPLMLTLPVSFMGPNASNGATGGNKAGAIDCVVR
jgi:hypothetical protein